MNDEQKIIAIALLDGFKPPDNTKGEQWVYNNPYCHTGIAVHVGPYNKRQIDEQYLTSRDVIVPVRLKVCATVDLRVKWLNAARTIVGRRMPQNKVGTPLVSDFDIAGIEPAEDCEALLRATGKWKE